MSFDQWSERNASLNSFKKAIHRGTHGRIRDLALDFMDDGSVVVCGFARSYHVIQLALLTTKQFGNAHRISLETRLLLRIGDKQLEYLIAHAKDDNRTGSLSTRAADRHPQLTLATNS